MHEPRCVQCGRAAPHEGQEDCDRALVALVSEVGRTPRRGPARDEYARRMAARAAKRARGKKRKKR